MVFRKKNKKEILKKQSVKWTAEEKVKKAISEKTLSEHLISCKGFSEGHSTSGMQKDHRQLSAATRRALPILLLSFSKTQ